MGQLAVALFFWKEFQTQEDGFPMVFGGLLVVATICCCKRYLLPSQSPRLPNRKLVIRIIETHIIHIQVTFTHTYYISCIYSIVLYIYIQYQEKNLMSPTTKSSRYPQEKQKKTPKNHQKPKKNIPFHVSFHDPIPPSAGTSRRRASAFIRASSFCWRSCACQDVGPKAVSFIW